MSLQEFQEHRKSATVAAGGEFRLGDQVFVLYPSTPEVIFAWNEACREMVRESMVDPITAANRKLNEITNGSVNGGEPLNPLLAQELVKQALAAHTAEQGKGKPEPTQEQVFAKMMSLDGVRWVVWYRVSRVYPEITQEFVNEHVTKENLFDVTRQLGRIDKPGVLDPKPVTTTG